MQNEHKVKFENWVRTNFQKEDICFPTSNCSTLMESITLNNDRIHAEADIKSGIVNFRKRLWFGLEDVLKDFRT